MYIYIYNVPKLNAVKIGKGYNPTQRMKDYCEKHELAPDVETLRFWEVGDAVDKIERWLHKATGLKKFYYGRAIEIFEKGDESFATIEERIKRLISTNPYNPVNVIELDTLDFPTREAVAEALRKWAFDDYFKRPSLIASVAGSDDFHSSSVAYGEGKLQGRKKGLFARWRARRALEFDTPDSYFHTHGYDEGGYREHIPPGSGVWSTTWCVYQEPRLVESFFGVRITVNGKPLQDFEITDWLDSRKWERYQQLQLYWVRIGGKEVVQKSKLDYLSPTLLRCLIAEVTLKANEISLVETEEEIMQDLERYRRVCDIGERV